MKKAEYIDSVLEQVRCKAVHDPLKRELETHIDEQTEAYIASGMTEGEAEEKAVETMGSPNETGIQLDRVHRPDHPLAMLLFIALFLAAGFIIYALLTKRNNFSYFNMSISAGIPLDSAQKYLMCIPIAAAVTLLFYFMDYTVFTRIPKTAYVIFSAVLFVGMELIFDREMSRRFVFYGTMLYAPLMCGVVYSMNGKGFKGFVLACFALVVPPVFINIYAPCISGAVMSGITALVIMTTAVSAGRFKLKKRTAYLFMYIPAALGTAGIIWLKLFRASEEYGLHFERDYIREILSHTQLFSQSGADYSQLSSSADAHLLTAVIADLGLIAGIAVTLIITAFPMIILILSSRVKNPFGRITAISISAVFVFQTVCYILANYGISTSYESYVTVPFLTNNPANMAVGAALTGIFMSVYRRRNIFPEQNIVKKTKA